MNAQETDDLNLINPPIGTPWTSDFRVSNIERFTFSSIEDSITTVIVENEALAQGITATLVEMDDRETISAMNLNIGAVAFCVPRGNKDYILTIENPTTNDADSYEALITHQPTEICGGNLIDSVMNDAQTADNEADDEESNDENNNNDNSSDENSTDNTCTAITQSNANAVNVRSLPSTLSPVLAVENVGNEVDLMGQALDGSWVLVGLSDGRSGYISTSVLSIANGCVILNLPISDYDEASLQALEISVNIDTPSDSAVDITATEDNINVQVASDEMDNNVIDTNINSDGMDINIGGDDGININLSDEGIEVNLP